MIIVIGVLYLIWKHLTPLEESNELKLFTFHRIAYKNLLPDLLRNLFDF
jgi:hypothetical protein